MGWSIRVARIAGIDVKLHITFLLFLIWIGVTHYQQGGAAAARQGLIFILLLFACVVLHEFGHALAARRYGIGTRDIILLPIGGVARITRIPRNPRQELVIALAGPAVNVGIALVLYLLLNSRSSMGDILAVQNASLALAGKLLTVNIWLVLFNLIPAFPMDGGRVLRALLALRLPHVRATQVAAVVGQAIAFGFGFLGLFYNPLLIFIALFVYLGAAQEASLAQMRDLTERLPVSAAMLRDMRVLSSNAALSDAVDALLQTSQHEFPVVDAAGNVAGVLTRDDLISGLRHHGPAASVARVMRTAVPEIPSDVPFDVAFEQMQESRSPVVAVKGADGRVAGFITAENLGELVLVQSALAKGKRG